MRVRVKEPSEPNGPAHGWGQVRNRPYVDPTTNKVVYGIQRVHSGEEFDWHAAPDRVPPWCEVVSEAPGRAASDAPAATTSEAPLAAGEGFPANVRHLGGPWYEITAGNLTEKVMGKKKALDRAEELRMGPVPI